MVGFVFNWLISEDQGANLNRRKAFKVLLFIYLFILIKGRTKVLNFHSVFLLFLKPSMTQM